MDGRKNIMTKAIINVSIYDYKTFHQHAFVIFDETIHHVGDMKDYINLGYEEIDGKDHMVLPNFVCGHTHIYSAFARGWSTSFNPKNFQDILDQLWWKLDGHLDLEMIHSSGIVFAVDFLKNGVTTLIDHHASGVDIIGSLEELKKAVCEIAHLRGIFAFETSDRFPIDLAIKENETFIRKNRSPFVHGLFGLHASMSLSEATLKKVKIHLGDAPIHIHVGESELDQQDSLKKYHERIIHRLDRHGLLNKNSIIAHAIDVTDDELDLIKKRECVIAVNFTSNMNNSVGVPPIHRFIEKGIKVIVGNDGISQAMTPEYLYLYYATHLKDKTPTAFGLGDLQQMINDTYQYASDILGVQLGKIEQSYASDLLMIPYIAPTPMNQDNALGHLFFGMYHSFKPKHVFVNGRQLVTNYEIDESLKTPYQKANEVASQLWKNIKQEVK
jgi:cytosine/adenosine deaminase-related metal-dependent hydrolase